LDTRLTTLLCEKITVAKSKVKTGSNLAESSKKGYRSKSAVFAADDENVAGVASTLKVCMCHINKEITKYQRMTANGITFSIMKISQLVQKLKFRRHTHPHTDGMVTILSSLQMESRLKAEDKFKY
jgi:hypothetical protein